MLTTTSFELRPPATVIVIVLPSSLTKVRATGAFQARLGDRSPSLVCFALIRPAAVRHIFAFWRFIGVIYINPHMPALGAVHAVSRMPKGVAEVKFWVVGQTQTAYSEVTKRRLGKWVHLQKFLNLGAVESCCRECLLGYD